MTRVEAPLDPRLMPLVHLRDVVPVAGPQADLLKSLRRMDIGEAVRK